MEGKVVALAISPVHHFSKQRVSRMRLIAGHGAEGDAHAGATVQHRSRVKADPTRPNLRQIHLLHSELLDQLAAEGFAVAPGDLGENITTSGLPLLDQPTGTLLRIGEEAQVEITGLRNPCWQIDAFRPGLLPRLALRDPDGGIIRLAGVMGVVRCGGEIVPGDIIAAHIPPGEARPLLPV